MSVTQDLTHVQFFYSETESFTEEPIHEYSRNVATIRRTSCTRFK